MYYEIFPLFIVHYAQFMFSSGKNSLETKLNAENVYLYIKYKAAGTVCIPCQYLLGCDRFALHFIVHINVSI